MTAGIMENFFSVLSNMVDSFEKVNEIIHIIPDKVQAFMP